MLDRVGDRPVLAALAGAGALVFSGIFFRLADVSARTGAFLRCVYALPPLWLLARWEDRRFGARTRRARWLAYGAGLLLAADLVLWHRAIEEVGAGLGTVLANVQVVLVGLLAWAVLRERPPATAAAAIPVALVGVILISGAFEADAYGDNPALGGVLGVSASIAYSGFLLVFRESSRDLRRPAGPLFDATLASALGAGAIGLALGDLDLFPPLSAQGWLIVLALSVQVLGWLVIAISLPRLPAALTSVLLTLQPVLSVVFAALTLGESPSTLQLVGVAAILAGLVIATSGRRAPAAEPGFAPAQAGTRSP